MLYPVLVKEKQILLVFHSEDCDVQEHREEKEFGNH
jgi:hypothetical protein